MSIRKRLADRSDRRFNAKMAYVKTETQEGKILAEQLEELLLKIKKETNPQKRKKLETLVNAVDQRLETLADQVRL